MDLTGKKLLIIGSGGTEIAIVRAAKALGVYTVCCDGITDLNKIPAKLSADEYWNNDYSNINEIVQKCRENHIDGVLAGYSEWRVLAASKIAKSIKVPFYATPEQIEITRNKRKFKDLCILYDVPVPKDYYINLPFSEKDIKSIVYPVIIKPVDNGGRKGISVCNDESELNKSIKYALNNSNSKKIIIEEFVKGNEITAIYTLVDGKIKLSLIKDKYHSDEYPQLCSCTITPSVYSSRFISEVDSKIRNLLKGISAKNGVCFFQMIANQDSIKVFEMGYRLNGGNDYKIISRINGENYMDMLINYSLTGEMAPKEMLRGCNNENTKECIYSELLIHCHGGVIGKIDFSKVKKINGVIEAYCQKQVGMEVLENGTSQHTCGRVIIRCNSIEELNSIIQSVYNSAIVLDVKNENMIFKPFNILKYYNSNN